MARALRIAPEGVCFHVLNRGNDRRPLFRKEADFAAFIAILTEAIGRFEIDLFSWCLMPNHWHLVLRPRTDTALRRFMAWLTLTHVRRHHAHHPSFSGHLYQGRYKSFPVEADDYFLALARYVEANPLRAKLAERAEDWRWSSLWQRRSKSVEPPLADWPVDRPAAWRRLANEPMADELRAQIASSLRRHCPLGSAVWSKRIAQKLKLRQTLNPLGRPRRPLSSLSVRQKQRRKAEEATDRVTS